MTHIMPDEPGHMYVDCSCAPRIDSEKRIVVHYTQDAVEAWDADAWMARNVKQNFALTVSECLRRHAKIVAERQSA